MSCNNSGYKFDTENEFAALKFLLTVAVKDNPEDNSRDNSGNTSGNTSDKNKKKKGKSKK
jgi:hypothetical protein